MIILEQKKGEMLNLLQILALIDSIYKNDSSSDDSSSVRSGL